MAVPRSKTKKKPRAKLNMSNDLRNKYTLDRNCIKGGQRGLCFKECKKCTVSSKKK